jgi:hypothetical protein
MTSRPKVRGALAIATLTLAFALSQASCGGGHGGSAYPPAHTNAPAEWSAIAVKALLDASAATPAGVSPMEESRAYAMAFTAVHDALNAIDRRYKPYLSDLRAPDTGADAAVAGAIHAVLKSTLPSQTAVLDAAYAEALARVSEGSAKAAGVGLGQQTAQAILAARAGTAKPEAYQFTPPFDFAAFVNCARSSRSRSSRSICSALRCPSPWPTRVTPPTST